MMQSNGYPTPGHGAFTNGSGQPYQINGTGPRPLTVDEALPYSPFASVIPFNSGILPIPSVGLRTSTSMFSGTSEREVARRGLEGLNEQTLHQGGTSKQLEQTLRDLKELLSPGSLTQFQFKTAAKPNQTIASTRTPEMDLHLSPFTQLLYNQTDVAFRSLPSVKQEPRVKNGKVSKAPLKQRSPVSPKVKKIPPQKTSTHLSNEQAYVHNSSIEVKVSAPSQQNLPGFSIEVQGPSSILDQQIHFRNHMKETPIPPPQRIGHRKSITENPISPQQLIKQPETPSRHTPTSTPNTISRDHFSIVIPQASSIIKTNQYLVYDEDQISSTPTPGTMSHAVKKRKRSEAVDDDELPDGTADQREKADTAFRNLQQCMSSIFEAEEQIHLDPNSNIVDRDFFVFTGDDVLSLANPALTRVDPLIARIIKLHRFAQVPVDDLARLQKLCEGSIRTAETANVKIDETWDDSDIESWLQQLSTAEVGLRAARLSLQVMAGGREEKQLYSEEIIQASLNAFKNVVDSCIIPIVEMRPTGSSAKIFKLLVSEKKVITTVLTQCRYLLSLLKELIASIELSETVINTLEFSVSQMIFVENGHTEKDSILGIQKFDSLRVVAMDTLAQIFFGYPVQRRGIFDEILTSLEKLPVTKQSARQFKLVEGGSIQLVSALIMRLIQTSGNKSDEGKDKRRGKALEALNDSADDDADEIVHEGPNINGLSNGMSAAHDTERRAERQPITAIQELREVVNPLLESARGNASYVVGFIVDRAMRSTKTGDAPYRNLLDLFVQDFITCLNSTDWPAAELLLRVFLVRMVKLAESDKTAAPAKNMALDVLAEMGSAISQLSSHVRKPVGTLENADADTALGVNVLRLVEASFEGRVRVEDLVSWTGPFRVVLEILEERCSTDSALRSAIGFHLAEWATQVIDSYESITDETLDHTQAEEAYGRLAFRLRKMISDKTWFITEHQPRALSSSSARLAYSLTLLSSQFCNSFDRILKILLDCMRSEQATVRSKSLRSINQVLETDPSILDRFPGVMRVILDCSSDSSVQVRDSALGLIGKCIGLKPALEDEMIPGILQRVSDTGIGVRKRAIKLLKEIYLRNDKKEIRSAIADALLHRVVDLDEGVQDLARTTIEEVWMHPFYVAVSAPDNDSVPYKLAVADHVALMVKTVQRRTEVSGVLDKVLQSMLSGSSKNAAANFRVCKTLVATMFDTIIDNSDGGAGEARDALQLLMIFAKANARLFTADQIQLLPPYIADLKKEDDLAKFRSVVVIFRHVFPQLSTVHKKFLQSVRETLMKSVSRMNRTLLDDVLACLWIISSVLGNTDHLGRLACSSLAGVAQLSKVNFAAPGQEAPMRKLTKLLMISGMCGKHFDLKDQAEVFRASFPAWKDKERSVSKLMVDTFAPFASPSQPLEVRKPALDALGLVCPSWPKNFSSVNIYTTFQQVFQEQNPVLEAIVMKSFKDFLLQEEKRAEPGAEVAVGAGIETPATLGIMGGTQHDGVATEIAQKFLKDITRIALATQNEHALLATEILTSINRQGMTHPKECGPALVALETSQNTTIADMAFREHRALHEKHETILEKEYMRAIQSAFLYQRDIVHDTRGAKLNPYTSKLYLLMEVLKISKIKSRKRFFESLCARVDFEPAKLDTTENLPTHVDFSRFVVENMAFFEYLSIDELLIAVTAMEKIVAGTGTTIAHAIETEIFHISMDQSSQTMPEDGQVALPSVETVVDPNRLRHLTAASMILSGVWESRTQLRRTYGLMTNKRDGKGKISIKDLNKAPVKAQGITGDKYWDEMTRIMAALSSPEAMMEQCKAFVELLTVDKDFKISAEGDDDITRARNTTPSEDEGDTPGPPSGSKRGRARPRKLSSTPGKKRGRSTSRGPGRARKVAKRESVGSDEDAEGEWE